MDDFVVKAVEAYIQMERDARVIDLLRKEVITGVSCTEGRWRVDARAHFFIEPTLEAALAKALEGQCNG